MHPEARAGLQALFGGGAEAGSVGRGSWADRPADRQKRATAIARVAAALRWALDRARQSSQSGQVALLIDELHHVDGASRNAFATLVEAAKSPGTLLVATHEPGFDPGWTGAETLSLDGLSPEQVADVLESGPASLPAGVLRGAGGQPSGVLPLYLLQFAHFVAEGGADAPTGLADLMAQRIERFDVEPRRILQALAVLGDEAPRLQVAALVPDVRHPDTHLQTLCNAGLLACGDDRITISHPLLRDIALLGMPAEVRRQLHRRARDHALVGEAPMPLEAQAEHACAAEDAFEALMLLEQVAEQAGALSDVEGSIHVLRRGLELARREMSRGELDDPLGAVLHFSRKLGDALAGQGSLSQADGVLREALDLGGPRAPSGPRILVSLADVAHARGRAAVARAYLQEASEMAITRCQPELLEAIEQLGQSWREDH